eukprot:gene9896-biopygen689
MQALHQILLWDRDCSSCRLLTAGHWQTDRQTDTLCVRKLVRTSTFCWEVPLPQGFGAWKSGAGAFHCRGIMVPVEDYHLVIGSITVTQDKAIFAGGSSCGKACGKDAGGGRAGGKAGGKDAGGGKAGSSCAGCVKAAGDGIAAGKVRRVGEDNNSFQEEQLSSVSSGSSVSQPISSVVARESGGLQQNCQYCGAKVGGEDAGGGMAAKCWQRLPLHRFAKRCQRQHAAVTGIPSPLVVSTVPWTCPPLPWACLY